MELLEIIKQHPIIPVYYHDDPETCQSVLKSCYDGGVRVFEFVNRGDRALTNFQILQDFRNRNFPDLKLGIGTIKNAKQARQFIDLKTDFIVSPIFNAAIGDLTKEENIPWFPGCMTPTEVSWAIEAGCELIKIFPGNIVGSGFIKALKAVFPESNFMPTGGVKLSEDNLKQWFTAGVTAVGIGSSLFSSDKTFDSIQQDLKNAFDLIKSFKN